MKEKSIWKLIYEHLTAAGFKVYSPGQHIGECKEPYIVLKDAGATRFNNFSTDVYTFDFLCYVPLMQFSTMEDFVASIKHSLKEMFPLIKPTGYQTGSYLDDTIKAHMVSFQYTNYKKVFYN